MPSTATPSSRSSRAWRPARASSAASWSTAPAPSGRCRANSAARRRWRSSCCARPRDLGLDPYGVSFHVGSQQTDLDAVGRRDRPRGEDVLAAGGGRHQPAHGQYRRRLPGALPQRRARVERYAAAVMAAITRHFGNDLPEIIVEPGRSIVGDAGVIQSEVVLISRKSFDDEKRWVYLDIGKFNGLAETMDESIKYRIRTPADGGAVGPVGDRRPDLRQRRHPLREDRVPACRSTSRSATRSRSSRPAPIRRATPRSASTASRRSRPTASDAIAAHAAFAGRTSPARRAAQPDLAQSLLSWRRQRTGNPPPGAGRRLAADHVVWCNRCRARAQSCRMASPLIVMPCGDQPVAHLLGRRPDIGHAVARDVDDAAVGRSGSRSRRRLRASSASPIAVSPLELRLLARTWAAKAVGARLVARRGPVDRHHLLVAVGPFQHQHVDRAVPAACGSSRPSAGSRRRGRCLRAAAHIRRHRRSPRRRPRGRARRRPHPAAAAARFASARPSEKGEAQIPVPGGIDEPVRFGSREGYWRDPQGWGACRSSGRDDDDDCQRKEYPRDHAGELQPGSGCRTRSRSAVTTRMKKLTASRMGRSTRRRRGCSGRGSRWRTPTLLPLLLRHSGEGRNPLCRRR